MWSNGKTNALLMAMSELALILSRGDAVPWCAAEEDNFRRVVRTYVNKHREFREAIEALCWRHGVEFAAEEAPSNVIRGVDFRAAVRER
jgi:hypothetical protein